MLPTKQTVKQDLRSRVLHLLGQHPQGLSEADILRALLPRAASVPCVTEITRALMTLKHQHRVWPVGGKWTVTSKGKRSHG